MRTPDRVAISVALLAAFASSPVLADKPAGSLDLRIGAGTFEIDDGFDVIESDMRNLQLRGGGFIDEHVFLRGSISGSSGSEVKLNGSSFDVDMDVNLWRLGGGYRGGDGSVRFYGVLELAGLEIKVEGDEVADDSGFVLSGGIQDDASGAFLWNVELGLVSFKDSSGAVFDWTIGYRFTPSFAMILGGQAYSIEDDANATADLSAGMLGARFTFN